VTQQLIARSHAIASNKRSFLKPAKRPPHHRFEEKGPRLLLRIQQTLKSVQIMTSNDCPFRRQLMQQLPITMIDQMKQIKVIADPSHHPRIIPEPIQKPVSIKPLALRCLLASAFCLLPCQSSPHLRADFRYLNRPRAITLKVPQQHLADEVHAGPAFLE
jgi:hypothetical protein